MSTSLTERYKEATAWLFQQFPSFQQKGASAYKPDIGNIEALLAVLHVDLSNMKFIHIAGTNGKGSCTNYLGSILIEQGYTTGVFSSPHIVDYRERIIVNGEMIDEESVITFCDKIKKLDFSPSFFEITLALAFTYFAQKKCEYVVLETGLGGRLDATNVVTPILSVITNIGLDHTQLLGDTLSKVAYEKAGIIKTKVPVLIGEYTSETMIVFTAVATEKEAPLFLTDDFVVETSLFEYDNYQKKNEKTILKAIDILQTLGVEIAKESVLKGFENVHKNTSYRGRFQIMSKNPKIIVDVAHNVEGIKDLLLTIKQINHKKLRIIYGASSDKNYQEIIRLFPKEATIYFTAFMSERSVKIEELELAINDKDEIHYYFDKVEDAIELAKSHSKSEDLILITGSFYLISDFFSTNLYKTLAN